MNPASLLRGLPAAFVFLTRVPVRTALGPDDFRAASAFFPFVGTAVGLVGAVAFVLAQPLGEWVAAFLAIAATLFLTGAMHEDGLADSADALFGGTSRERVLAIAKDPRVGSFGVLALLVVVGTRIACIATHPGRAFAGFVLGHTLGRLAATATMTRLPYVQDDAVSKSEAVFGTTREHLGVALGWSGVVIVGLVLLRGVSIVDAALVVVTASLTTLGLGLYYRRRLGGIVGDFLGATIQLVELSVWLVLSARAA